jgi:hypothetical protein
MPSATAHAPPALRLPLRPYQEEAIHAILDAQTRGVTRPLVVLPVGAGKTIVVGRRVPRGKRIEPVCVCCASTSQWYGYIQIEKDLFIATVRIGTISAQSTQRCSGLLIYLPVSRHLVPMEDEQSLYCCNALAHTHAAKIHP